MQGTALGSFGFTGELQQGGNVYLRARWYDAGRGRFVGRDPFVGWGEQPYSLHPYAYGYADPVRWTDPTGENPFPDPTGRVSWLEGIYIGARIQMDFLAGNSASRRAEYAIPGASNGVGRGTLWIPGFADMVDFTKGRFMRSNRNATILLQPMRRYSRLMVMSAD